MDCTICANEVSRRGGLRATCVPVSWRAAAAARGRSSRRSGDSTRRFRSSPAFAGFRRSQMCFCFTKTLAGGAIPRTPSTTSASEGGTARTSFVLGEQVLCRPRAALEPFPEGSLVRERPGGEGGMGLHMPSRPYAAPGIPKGRVAPVHGPQTRSGNGDPQAVAQPQPVRQLAEPAFRTPERSFAARAPRCRIHTSGSATGSAPRRSNSDSVKTGLSSCSLNAAKPVRAERSGNVIALAVDALSMVGTSMGPASSPLHRTFRIREHTVERASEKTRTQTFLARIRLNSWTAGHNHRRGLPARLVRSESC